MSFWTQMFGMPLWGSISWREVGLALQLALAIGLVWAWWSVRRARLEAEARAEEAAALVGRARTTAVEDERARAELRHDAANSFAGIRAALKVISEGAIPAERLGAALEHELEHLERLVLGAVEDDVDFSLDELVHEAALLYAAQGMDVEVRSESAAAHGRPADVRRAVGNLLTNARRHGRGTVELAVRAAEAGVEVAVSDEGPGVPDELADRIFERGATTNPQRGSGLGLHVSRRLLRGQRGDLSLVKRGGGTTFAIRLPAAAPAPGVLAVEEA